MQIYIRYDKLFLTGIFCPAQTLKLGEVVYVCIEWLLLSDFNIIVKGHCFMYYRPWEKGPRSETHTSIPMQKSIIDASGEIWGFTQEDKILGEKFYFFFKAEHKYFWKNHILSANIELLLHLKPTVCDSLLSG